MKSKKIITAMLGLFVILSIGTLIYNSSTTSNRQKTEETSVESIKQSRRIDATYFHGTKRCYTCNLMEKYIKETLNENFSDKMKNGKINFQTINVEEFNNNHYVKDYKLHTKSFILSLKDKDKEEKWLNCDKIWNLVRNEITFKNYIKTEVNKYLGML